MSAGDLAERLAKIETETRIALDAFKEIGKTDGMAKYYGPVGDAILRVTCKEQASLLVAAVAVNRQDSLLEQAYGMITGAEFPWGVAGDDYGSEAIVLVASALFVDPCRCSNIITTLTDKYWEANLARYPQCMAP